MAATAFAQETITLQVAVKHPVLLPGQAQTVTVSAFFEPGMWQPAIWDTNGGTGQSGFVRGFAEAFLDLRNRGNAQTGVFSDFNVNLSPFGSPGTVKPSGEVEGIFAFQFEPADESNPIWLWRATWTPTDYTPRTVSLETAARNRPQMFIWIPGISSYPYDAWDPITSEVSFDVVPAPGLPATLLMLGASIARRPGRR
ncbi:MAG: hypothetical protein IT437_13040 [Phycisphaerales bacterium]|nr:hypothetical protein [Phycisphaerales bacterium]